MKPLGTLRPLAFVCIHTILAALCPRLAAQTPQFAVPVIINPGQTITYQPTPKGDRIPDFSTVGYNYGNSALPNQPGGYQVPVLVTLSPQSGDQTDRIQAAIDFISAKPLVNGFRGALLLKAGRWELYSKNKISIKSSGVVIRGEGDHPLTGTRLYAIGTTNENGSGNTHNSQLISFTGGGNSINTAAPTWVDSVYVPAGINVIPITGHAFTVNQRIQVRWPGTVAWQKASFYDTTATADKDPAITFNRVITAVTPNSITLDGPLTSPLDPAYGRGYIVPATSFNNITNVGISHCYFESVYATDTDENHLWIAACFANVEDGFMHNCTSRYFAYSIAYVDTNSRKITIDRCQFNDGISQLGGGRRYSFVLTGEMALVSNTLSRYGRHSYVINWPAAPGLNVFVDGVSSQSYNESGSHSRWNNGGLWDNISTLSTSTTAGLQVKLERPSAYCVAWNCVTNYITFENMPLSPNWSLGTTNSSGGPATWVNSTGAINAPYLNKAEQWSNGTRMPVRSLYENQVAARLAAANNPYRYQANLPTRIAYPPVIRAPGQLVALSGSAWSYQLPVSNLVSAVRTPNYTVSGLPAGVTVNVTTGLISGTLPTVATNTIYNLTLSARNIDGTTTAAMTLTVQPATAPKISLTMTLEVNVNLTTPLPNSATNGLPVPMVPASRLLAPMIVKKAYISDLGSGAYTAADIPVPVRAVLPVEGLTSPITITYNGSTTLPTAAGYYDVVATLNDPSYQATATSRLLITNATAVTVTLGNTTAPTVASPVTATSTQPTITPVVTYDGSPTFPTLTGLYTAKAVVADPEYFGSRAALIGVPPQITQQPVSLTVNQGASATFSVAATGIASTYQWRKAGVAIPGATGTSFSIASAQGSDTDSYDVVVTDQTGVTPSATVTLVVIVPPQVTQQPASINVAQGSPATLSVTATGGALTYQWRKASAPISGATSASYTLPAVSATDAASYDVVITNSRGTVTSASATLTVVLPPQITQQPLAQTVNQGTATTFTVSATGIANTYQWRKATAPITGAIAASYAISSAQATDAASYDVVVTNIAGNATSTAATLTVTVPPQITQQPVSQVVTLGASATFTVGASGISATYQWRKGGVAIAGATGTSYTIASVQTTDSGSYDVVVTNPAGSATSAAAALTPLNPSGIVKLNNTTALDLGGSWTGATVPGIYDTASWNGTYTSGSVSIGTGLSVGRLQILSPSTAITINSGTGPLTLSGGGIDMSIATQNLTLNAPVGLTASQAWPVAGSRTLNLNGVVSDGGAGYGLAFSGSGSTVLAANNTYLGSTSLSAGTLHLGVTTGATSGSVAGPFTLTGGTLRSNRTDAHSPIGGVFTSTVGTIQLNAATSVFTLNSTNLPTGSSNNFTTLTGVSGATFVVDGAANSSLGFGGSVAGMNLRVKNGAVNFTTNGGSFNFRVESGSFTATPVDRFQLATANQTFTVTGGIVDLTAASTYGFRVGGSGSSNQSGAQNVTATQSGGTVLATTMNLGGTDTDAVKNPSYTLSGGTFATTGSVSLGADSTGNGTTTFTLGGSGKLLVGGTLSGAQSGARQIFTINGGTLAAANLSFANLRSSDLTPNGSLTQTAGLLAPGDIGVPGRTAITGNYTLGANATLALDLGGTSAATSFQGTANQFDSVTVSGTSALSGNLSVSLVNSYTPASNAVFTVVSSIGTLSGAFANVPFGSRLLVADGQGSFLVNQAGNTVTLSGFLPVVVSPFVTPGANSVSLDWTGSTAVTYNLDRALSASGPYARIASGLTTTTFTDTNVVPGTQYYYQLSGTDSLGRTTTVTSGPPPAAPSGLAVAPGFTSNALNWNFVPGASGYQVKRALVASGPFVQIASLGNSTATYANANLTTGTTYYYVVTALNASGESAPSAVVSGTPVAGTATKANNTIALDLGSSWSTGVVPTVFDTTSWNGTYANGTVGIGGGLAVAQLKITSPSQAITINAGTGPLTLGAGGFDLSSSTQDLTVNAPVILDDNQSWTVTTSRTLTLNGNITESGPETSLTKSGAGLLVLTGPANFWTGATLVNAGTLRLGASAVIGSASSVSVAAGSTLSGTGVIQSPVTIAGILAPGLNGAGTLSLQSSLTLAAGSGTNLSIHRSSPSACSAVAGATAVTYGGTLTVTNAGAALVDGDRFVLFSSVTYSGAFATLNLPALNPGLVWNTSGLTVDGSILVRASTSVPATKYWDTSANAGLQGGPGAWDVLATANWNPAADGSGTLTTFWHLDSVVFQTGTANTLTLSGPVGVTSLSQSTNGTATTLNGGALVLAGSAPLSNGVPSGNAALTIQAPVRINNLPVTLTAAQPILLGQGLGGSGNITKTGNSTLTITGDSDWTGALTLDGGTTRFNGATPGLANIVYGTTAADVSSSTLQLTQDAALSSFTVQNLGANTLDLAVGSTLSVTGPVTLGLNGNGASIIASTTTSIAFTGGGSASFTDLGGSFIVAGGNKGGIVTADFSGLSALTINTGPAGNAFLGVTSSVTNDTLRLATDTTLIAANLYVGDANTGGTYSLVLGSGANVFNVDEIYVGQKPGANNRSDGSIAFPAGAANASLQLRAADGAGRANLLLNDNSSTTTRLLTTTFDVSGRFADLLLNSLVVGRRNASSSPAQLTNDTFRWDRGTLDVLQQVVLSQAPAAAQKTHVGTMVLGSANSTAADTAIFRGGILIAENRSTVTTAGATAQATLTVAGGSVTSAGITLGDIVTTTAPTSGTRQSLATLNITGGTLTLTAPLRSGTTGGPGNETSVLTLNGGTLDLGGNALGGVGTAAITTLTFQSGVLANVPSINGSSGLTKTGSGTLTLAGANSFTSPITVSSGTFVLASGATATVPITVASGATLVHAGTTSGDITLFSGATDAPDAVAAPRSLGGNYTLSANATLRLRLDSANAYDQVVLTGANSTITLGGTLDLVAASDLPAGTRFRILRNQGRPTASVVGTFAGRPALQFFTLAGQLWSLDYAAGLGSDVDLILATALQSWRQSAFGTTTASGIAADNADPDGDGVPNLLEYALGTDPNSASSVTRPAVQVSGSRLQLTFARTRADVTYIVEASSDLASWSAIATNPGTVGQSVTVTDTVDLSTASPPRRFLRLRVTSP